MEEEKIVDIQSRLAFQEDTLQGLNAVIARQQQEIRDLKKEIDSLKEGLRGVAAAIPGNKEEDPPPPHY